MTRILFLLLVLFGSYRLYDYLTDDFQVAHITYALPYKKEWETSPMTPEVEKILHQSFRYIGKGSQSYVFKSDDQKYVIKFFKFKHTKPSWLLNALPRIGWIATWQDYREARHQKKINRLFVGYKIAHDYNKEDSGLIYLHLNQEPIFGELAVFDKLGFERKIPLEGTSFIIQEAAIPTQEVLEMADSALANKRMEQLLAMYVREYQKGIYDKDHAVLRNTGFIGERPIHFDVGNFTLDPSMKDPATYEKDLAIIQDKLKTAILELAYKYKKERIESLE